MFRASYVKSAWRDRESCGVIIYLRFDISRGKTSPQDRCSAWLRLCPRCTAFRRQRAGVLKLPVALWGNWNRKNDNKITPAAIYRYLFLHSLSVHYGETLIGIAISQGPFWRIIMWTKGNTACAYTASAWIRLLPTAPPSRQVEHVTPQLSPSPSAIPVFLFTS